MGVFVDYSLRRAGELIDYPVVSHRLLSIGFKSAANVHVIHILYMDSATRAQAHASVLIAVHLAVTAFMMAIFTFHYHLMMISTIMLNISLMPGSPCQPNFPFLCSCPIEQDRKHHMPVKWWNKTKSVLSKLVNTSFRQ